MLLYFFISLIALNIIIWVTIISALHLSKKEDNWSDDIEDMLDGNVKNNVEDCDGSKQLALIAEN